MSSHPLHPALVHFPIACWTLGTAADIATHWLPAREIAAFLLGTGTISALPVMLAGAMDARRVKESANADTALALHMTFVILAWLAYALSLLSRWDGEGLSAGGGIATALSVVGFLVLILAGWFGGQLVYTHGVGVRRISPGPSSFPP